ncbi:MAG: hypothetical protein KJ915_00990 [Candidatus Omnitrophica bacterium]|nr:hypothetical protein [Candidatus Omnitrophota bacterium]
MKINFLAKKLAIFLFSFLLIFFLIEKIFLINESKFIFDTTVYVQHAKPALHKISKLPGLSYELIPGANTENGFFKINSRGIRDREYIIPKPENVYRIIVLGDSVTFGTEYLIEQTYPKLLEEKLNSNPVSGIKFEVLNAGVCAYNAVQKFILLKNRLIDYQPDLVIFQFLNDDYYRNAVILPGAYGSERHKHIDMGQYFVVNFPKLIPINPKIDRFFIKHSAVYRFINKSVYDFISLRNPGKYIPQAYKYAGCNNLAESMRINKQIFQEFKRLSEQENFEFGLMLVPELKNKDDMDLWIKQAGDKEFNFKTLDLFYQFKLRGIDLTDLKIIPQGGCHFNLVGHKLVADILYSWLRDDLRIIP